MKKKWKVVLLIILTAIIIFVVYFVVLVFRYKKAIEKGEIISPKVLEQEVNYNSQNKDVVVNRGGLELSSEPSMGASKPIMTIVAFCDFECSKCKAFYPTLRKFVVDNSDKVKIIFRDFPIISGDYTRSMFADCANEQNKFWQMHDALFDNQDNFNKEMSIDLSKEIGIDAEKFQTCIDENRYKADIDLDLALGAKLKLRGTPTVFINGTKFEGALSSDLLKQALYNIENYKK